LASEIEVAEAAGGKSIKVTWSKAIESSDVVVVPGNAPGDP
jgi:hypothetical protein